MRASLGVEEKDAIDTHVRVAFGAPLFGAHPGCLPGRKAEAKPWFDIAYLPRATQLTNDPEHDPNRRRLDDDPIAAVRQAKVPLLFLYGDSDPWVPVGESVQRLESLGRELPTIQYAVVSNANHEMMFPGNEKMQVDQETTRKEAPQAPSYFMLVASWIARRVAY